MTKLLQEAVAAGGQPAAGHEGMTIGIEQFRDPRELRLDRMRSSSHSMIKSAAIRLGAKRTGTTKPGLLRPAVRAIGELIDGAGRSAVDGLAF